MATIGSKAARRGTVQAELNKLVGALAEEFGIERPTVPLVRDPDLLAIYNLEADVSVLSKAYEELKKMDSDWKGQADVGSEEPTLQAGDGDAAADTDSGDAQLEPTDVVTDPDGEVTTVSVIEEESAQAKPTGKRRPS